MLLFQYSDLEPVRSLQGHLCPDWHDATFFFLFFIILDLIRNVKTCSKRTIIFQRLAYLIAACCALLFQMSETCLFLSWAFLTESGREVLLFAETYPSGELFHKQLRRHETCLAQGSNYYVERWKSTKPNELRCGQKIWRQTYIVRGLQSQVASSQNFFMCLFFVLIKYKDHMNLIKYPYWAEKIKFLLPAFHQRSYSVNV